MVLEPTSLANLLVNITELSEKNVHTYLLSILALDRFLVIEGLASILENSFSVTC